MYSLAGVWNSYLFLKLSRLMLEKILESTWLFWFCELCGNHEWNNERVAWWFTLYNIDEYIYRWYSKEYLAEYLYIFNTPKMYSKLLFTLKGLQWLEFGCYEHFLIHTQNSFGLVRAFKEMKQPIILKAIHWFGFVGFQKFQSFRKFKHNPCSAASGNPLVMRWLGYLAVCQRDLRYDPAAESSPLSEP